MGLPACRYLCRQLTDAPFHPASDPGGHSASACTAGCHNSDTASGESRASIPSRRRIARQERRQGNTILPNDSSPRMLGDCVSARIAGEATKSAAIGFQCRAVVHPIQPPARVESDREPPDRDERLLNPANVRAQSSQSRRIGLDRCVAGGSRDCSKLAEAPPLPDEQGPVESSSSRHPDSAASR